MKRIFFLLPILLLADVDPFAAGLNSSNPYGLTNDEKHILENKKRIDNLKKEINNIKKDINSIKLKLLNYDDIISNKLSAFPTLLDEVNNAMKDINNLKKKLNSNSIQIDLIQKKLLSLDNKFKSLEKNITILQNEVANIKISLNSIVEIQNQNFNNLRESINKILDTLRKMNRLTPKKAFLKARELFFSNRLDEAKKLFLFSLSKNYLPATSSYYLGEIAYKKKNYKEALAFYKKSVSLYSKKTSYMARLLYHTAISFEKLEDKNSAKLTLQKLLNDFPNSKYAKLAKKELEKLK